MAIEILQSLAQGTAGNMTGADIAETVNGLIGELGAEGKEVATFNADGTDDTQNFRDAFDALEDGQCLTLPQGAKITVHSRITVDCTNRDIYFNLNGATVIFRDQNDGFTFHGGFDTQAFGSLNSDGETIEGITDTSKIRERDYVRIISDDNPPDTWKPNAWNANDLFVEEILSPTSIRICGKYNFYTGKDAPYVTNPRITQRGGHRAVVWGGRITHATQVPATQVNYALLCFTGITNGIIYNMKIERGYSIAIALWANINTVVMGTTLGVFDDWQHEDDVNSYGYGIADSSFGTTILGCTGHRVRHLIDTSDHSYGTNRNPEQYGGSTNMTAINCVGVACSNSIFSTHHATRNANFVNCRAYNGHDAGFGIRGEVTTHGCYSYACAFDFNMFDEDEKNPGNTWLVSYNHVAESCGKIQNSVYGTKQHFYNYTAKKCPYNSGVWLKDRSESVTQFHGLLNIECVDSDNYNWIIGQKLKGTILFDEMILDVSHPNVSSLSRIFTNSVDGTYVYKLQGNHIHVVGSRPSTVFQCQGGTLPTDGYQFAITFDEEPSYGSGGSMTLCNGNDFNELGQAEAHDYGYWMKGCRDGVYRRMAVDFGAAVPGNCQVSKTVTIEGWSAEQTIIGDAWHLGPDAISVQQVRKNGDDSFAIAIKNLSSQTEDFSNAEMMVKIKKV